MKWYAVLLCWLVCLASQVAGQPSNGNAYGKSGDIVTINDEVVEHNFMPYQLQFYCDTTNTLQFSEVLHRNSHRVSGLIRSIRTRILRPMPRTG
jgi:hypothetical protein